VESLRRFRAFVQDSWKELRRTSWPSRNEVYGTTLVVILVTMLIAIFLGVVDLVLAQLARLLLGTAGA
jgi:preprotein translocase subunit SecE